MSARDDFGPPDEDDVARLRVPPHNREAEQSVLGGLLLDNGSWDRVCDLLQAKSFYAHDHRAIFEVISALVDGGKPADPITVHDGMTGRADVRGYGGLEYLEALAQSVPSASNARRYAEIVADRALERALVAAGDEIATMGFNGQGTAQQRVDRAATLLLALEKTQARVSSVRPLSELVNQRLDFITEQQEQGDENTGGAWPTPLAPLSRLLSGGFRPGKVYVVAARPSIGKSALAQSFAVHLAINGHPVLFLSQEMPGAELADRIISQLGAVDFGHLQRARLDDAEWSGLSYGVEAASKLPFFVDDQPALTIGQIRAKARSVTGLQVLVVDYLQLTASTPAPRGQINRNAEIEEVSRGLKSLAKELGLAVILLSQLNREVEKRPSKKPNLSDLRDSGAIEQDADVVLLLWPLKPDQQPGDGGEVPVGMLLAKNRGGVRNAEFPALFNGRLMRWGESELPLTAYAAVTKAGADI